MTKGIDNFFNLPHLDDVMKDRGLSVAEEQANAAALKELDDTAKQIGMSTGSDHAESMEGIYKEQLDHARTIIDLAYNVDDRARRGLLEIAASMYKNVMDAKNSKRDMQLKAMKLGLDQRKMDLEEKRFKAERGEDVIQAEATVMEDRNELIKQLLQQAKEEPHNK